MLIFTNGDCAAAALRAAGIPGRIVAWRDLLHDGPVPAGLELAALSTVRARFIAGCGWGEPAQVAADFEARDRQLEAAPAHDEVALVFEHDLYDQLQLLQLLAELAARPVTRLRLLCDAIFVGSEEPPALARRFAARRPVGDAELALARRAWYAFRQPTPTALAALLAEDLRPLPFLRSALRRLLEEYPSPRDGLGRSERQVLVAAADGGRRPRELFRLAGAMEEAPYLGDLPFRRLLEGLCAGPEPLLRPTGGVFRAPPGDDAPPLVLTAAGRRVLAGRADAVAGRGIDRWLGGVHLVPGHLWRWDGESLHGPS